MVKLLLQLVIILLVFFSISCGKKEPPSLPLYKVPQSPSDLNAIHREGELLLRWSYPTDIKVVVMRVEDIDNFKELGFVEKGNLYIDKDFKIGSTYKYKLITKDRHALSSSEIVVCPMQTPLPPRNVSFKIMEDSVNIRWQGIEENVYFNIYRSTQKGNYHFKPLNKTPLKEPSFNDNINIDTTVYYTVRALLNTSIRDESLPSEELIITPDDYIPSEPQALQAIPTAKGVQLIWDENPELWIKGYRVYRAKEGEDFKYIGRTETPAFLDKEQLSGKLIYRISAIGPQKEGPCSKEVKIQ